MDSGVDGWSGDMDGMNCLSDMGDKGLTALLIGCGLGVSSAHEFHDVSIGSPSASDDLDPVLRVVGRGNDKSAVCGVTGRKPPAIGDWGNGIAECA